MESEPIRGATRKQEVTANMEDYLEAILEICAQSGKHEARVTDIARRLNVTRPSVVGMIKHLGEHGLVSHGHYRGVRLTDDGVELAKEMAERHRVLRRFLEDELGLDAEIAEQDACRMEHTLSPETIDRFIALEEFSESAQGESKTRKEAFRNFLRDRRIKQKGEDNSHG